MSLFMPDLLEFTEQIKRTWLREEFAAKSVLVKEGTLAKKLFFIEAGCCRCWFYTADGRELTVNFGC